VNAPVRVDDVILKNVLGTGIDIRASREMVQIS
jgi:CxxC motif-containing protein